MQNIRIQTTQNVAIEYEAASIGDRIVAGLIDWLLLGAYWTIIYQIAVNLPFGVSSQTKQILFFIALIPHGLYHVLCEIFLSGQSIGKKIRKIKVARLDGVQPSFGNYVMRWILRPVDMFPGFYGMGIVAISSNGMGQRLGDMAAGTTVVNLQRRINWEEMLLSDTENEHTPTFLHSARLTDQDVEIIQEVLDIFKNSRNRNAAYLVQHTAYKVSQMLEAKTEMSGEDFLQTVLKDHSFLAGK